MVDSKLADERLALSDEDDDEFLEEVTAGEVAGRPGETADPEWLVEAKVPADIRTRYEVHSYRSAATILAESHGELFDELCDALRAFSITETMIRTAGGNESQIPKLLSAHLRPLGWEETIIQGDLLVSLTSRELAGHTRGGKPKFNKRVRELKREKYLDGHKVDYVKGRVAFDLEWNSKDQTFDRDLYAMSAFAQCGVIDVGVVVTRSESLNALFRALGQSLKKDGKPEFKSNGQPRMTFEKYGASTTWMGKLLYRLNAGRNGACPILVIGITPKCVKPG